MEAIKIDTFFGDKPAHIEVSSPLGGGGGYYVMINNYYNGRVWKTNSGWIHDLHPTTMLQGDDVSVIIDLIEEKIKPEI